jgi:exopolysaccharide production protein ExoQ
LPRPESGLVNRAPTPVPIWEQVLAVALLFYSTNAVLPVVRQGGKFNPTFEGDSLIQALWAMVYLLSLLLLVTRCGKRDLAVVLRAPVLWAAVGLTVASIAWSPVPATSIQRSFALVGTTLLGVYVGTRFAGPTLWRLLGWTFALVAFSSVFFAVLLPEYGLSEDKRGLAWQGVFTTKGQLGRIMVLSALLWLLYIRESRRHLLFKLAMFGLSAALVVLSQSVTSLVVLIALLGFIPMFRLIRLHYIFVVPMLATYSFSAMVAVTWSWLNLGEVADLLGRDRTLTGRTLLWQEVWERILDQPILGYGYSGFWRGLEGPSGEVWIATGWQPPHAHNGYLDIWLQLGFVGLLLTVLLLVGGLLRSLIWTRMHRGVEGEFPLLFFLFNLVTNISEVSILVRNTFYWVLFTVLLLRLAAVPLWQAQRAPAVGQARADGGTGYAGGDRRTRPALVPDGMS